MTLRIDDPAWPAVADEALADLQTLLRFPTVNPPGDEGPAADWIEARLREEGIDVERLDDGPRANVVARIPGSGSGGGPLLLAGHIDVVPVEREHWVCDPFGGEIRDGYLYGRGAVDMKNMVVMCMTALRLAKRSGRTPTRDLVFAAVADEEEGCQHGSRYLVENHPEKVRAEYMIGEIGGFSQDILGKRYYPIQIAEKGTCRIRLTAKGDPGHGSMPHDTQAVVRLAQALDLLGRTPLPVHITDAFRAFVRALAAEQRAPLSRVLGLLEHASSAGLVVDRLLPDKKLARTLSANLRNTVTPTLLSAGSKINLIPASAEATLDGRLLPGQSAYQLVQELRDLIGPAIDIEVIESHPGREELADDPLYAAICDNIRRHDPEGIPLPTPIPGFTDARYFGKLGARCYGYSPLRFPREDKVVFSELFHGHNERIHVEGFQWGLGCLWDLVARFIGLGPAR